MTKQEITVKELEKEIEKLSNDFNERLKDYKSRLNEIKNPKFEVWKWHKSINPEKKTLFVLSKAVVGESGKFINTDGYGFNHEGGWIGNNFNLYGSCPADFRPATKEEIESALIAEAKRRFVGVGIKCLHNANNGSLSDILGFRYSLSEDVLRYDNRGVGCCYDRGVWAEIIREEKITIGGYEVKWILDDTVLKVGCREIPKQWVYDLKNTMTNLKLNVVKFGDAEVTVPLINKILDKLK